MVRRAAPTHAQLCRSETTISFLNRDYPPVGNLEQLYRMLASEPRAVEELRADSQLGEEEFDKRWRSGDSRRARMDFAAT